MNTESPFTPEQAERVDRELLLDKQRDGYAQRQQAAAFRLQQQQDVIEQFLNRSSQNF